MKLYSIFRLYIYIYIFFPFLESFYNNFFNLVIFRGTFARNSLLKLLNLSNNKIKKLDSNTFRGMRFMRRLYLSDNEITDVGRGTFGSLNRIGTIDLARNFIKKVDYQMFNQLQYAEVSLNNFFFFLF